MTEQSIAAMIDSHIHLDNINDPHQLSLLAALMQEQGINDAIIPAVEPSLWSRQLQVANQFGYAFSLGIHPWYVKHHWQQQISELATRLAEESWISCRLVAIGECGLDGNYRDNFDWQLHSFSAQLALAKQYNLPVIIHAVKAHEQVLKLVEQAELCRGGVIHGFYGSPELATRYIRLGFKLGIGAILLNENAKKLQQVIQDVPLDCLVIETDIAQVNAVEQTTKTLNDPHFGLILPLLIKKIANLQKKSAVLVSEHVFCNTVQLFDL